MEAEYRSQKQGKNKDVQNYINAKHELFQLAFPNAQERDRVEFYRETTEGFINKYVWDQMFCFDANSIEVFRARAVNGSRSSGNVSGSVTAIPIKWMG